MRILLTSEAKKLITSSMKNPVILILRAGCGCSGLRMYAELTSKNSVDSLTQGLSFEELGEIEGILVLTDAQLKNYLEHMRLYTLAIDVDPDLAGLTVTSSS
jgi:hypothetical protein